MYLDSNINHSKLDDHILFAFFDAVWAHEGKFLIFSGMDLKNGFQDHET